MKIETNEQAAELLNALAQLRPGTLRPGKDKEVVVAQGFEVLDTVEIELASFGTLTEALGGLVRQYLAARQLVRSGEAGLRRYYFSLTLNGVPGLFLGDDTDHMGVVCDGCGKVILEESDGESTPAGSMHEDCALEYERRSPQDW